MLDAAWASVAATVLRKARARMGGEGLGDHEGQTRALVAYHAFKKRESLREGGRLGGQVGTMTWVGR